MCSLAKGHCQAPVRVMAWVRCHTARCDLGACDATHPSQNIYPHPVSARLQLVYFIEISKDKPFSLRRQPQQGAVTGVQSFSSRAWFLSGCGPLPGASGLHSSRIHSHRTKHRLKLKGIVGDGKELPKEVKMLERANVSGISPCCTATGSFMQVAAEALKGRCTEIVELI